MADPKFFTHAGALTLESIVALTGAKLLPEGTDTSLKFSDVAPLGDATREHVSFLDNIKYADAFAASKAGACFVRPKLAEKAPKGMIVLVTDEPYTAFALVSAAFYPAPAPQENHSPHAHISPKATIGKNCTIAPGVVIGDGVEIGDECIIGAHCTISHAILGKRVILHRGVHIGQDGFGFAPGRTGIVKVPQLGRVLVGNDVEIGSGTCIDRGSGPDTIIGDHCKIDNQVQIGHNVQLGKYVIIAAQAGIAGSTRIDDGVMLGGKAGIAGHLHIGAGAKIAANSGVMRDVPPGASYGGSPALPIREWHRQTVAIAKLAEKQ